MFTWTVENYFNKIKIEYQNFYLKISLTVLFYTYAVVSILNSWDNILSGYFLITHPIYVEPLKHLLEQIPSFEKYLFEVCKFFFYMTVWCCK